MYQDFVESTKWERANNSMHPTALCAAADAGVEQHRRGEAMPTYPQAGLTRKCPADLSWLTGSWDARIGADEVEEQWSSMGGGTLMGMFRWVRGGRVLFYELEVLEQEGELVYLRVKHFDPKLIGWEEKGAAHEFLLVELSERGAVFFELGKPDQRWAVYEREGPNKLRAYFTRDREPDSHPGVFEFVRQR